MIILFERYIKDNFYIKLEMDEVLDPTSVKKLSQYNIVSVVLTENIINSSPHMNVKFMDHNGSLVTTAPMLPQNVFTLTYGSNLSSLKTTKFKYSTSSFEPIASNTQENFFVNSDMIFSNWKKLFNDTYSRSWENTRYSDVITNIVADMEFDDVYVEKTKNIQNVIQPNINNASFIKWIKNNSVNDRGVGGYIYYITLDNEFYFRTIEDIIVNTPAKLIEHQTASSEEEGYNYSKITNDYANVLMNGGLGITHTNFDYSTKKFITNNVTVNKLKQRQMSDTTYILDSDANPSYNMYGGRDVRTNEVVANKMTSMINSAIKIDLNFKGRTDLKIGDKIDLVVPISKNMSRYNELAINNLYSGSWIVWKVNHIFDIKTSKYITKVFLFSDGLNNLNDIRYQDTSAGKYLV
jgi:hypothetical protein